MQRIVNIDKFAASVAPFLTLEQINGRLAKRGLPPMKDILTAAATLTRAEGVRTQSQACVLLLNITGGTVHSEDVTKALTEGFPGAKVGDRHGPHYMSLARTGKLEGLDKDITIIPHSARAKKSSTTVPTVVASKPAPTTAPAEPAPAVEVPALAAPAPAFSEEQLAEIIPPAAEPTFDPAAALKAELSALNQKDLAARAKKAGVKSTGKAADVIERILATV